MGINSSMDKKEKLNLKLEAELGTNFHYLYLNSLDSIKSNNILNENQILYLKKFVKFNENLLQHLKKETGTQKKYIMILDEEPINVSEKCIILMQWFFYSHWMESKKRKKYRYDDSKAYMETCELENGGFFPLYKSNYIKLFKKIIALYKKIIENPDQFVIGTVPNQNFEDIKNRVRFNQLF